MRRIEKGVAGDSRSSALWGTGSRGGEHRSDVRRGSRGRLLTLGMAALALAVPMVATAGSNGKGNGGDNVSTVGGYVSSGLIDGAKKNPDKQIRVIIRMKAGAAV